jgi:hypothetical protein
MRIRGEGVKGPPCYTAETITAKMLRLFNLVLLLRVSNESALALIRCARLFIIRTRQLRSLYHFMFMTRESKMSCSFSIPISFTSIKTIRNTRALYCCSPLPTNQIKINNKKNNDNKTTFTLGTDPCNNANYFSFNYIIIY